MAGGRMGGTACLVPAVALLLLIGGCVHQSTRTAGVPGAITSTHGAPLAPVTPVAAAIDPAEADAPGYYLEFRARPSPVIGHTYMVYGPLDAAGRPAGEHIVGLFPKGGALGLAGGFAPLPIPGGLDATWGDKHYPVMVKWGMRITPRQYADLVAFVAREKRKKKIWNVWVYNCNSFAADLAEAVGLRAPPLIVVPSQIYVAALRAMNEGAKSDEEIRREMERHVLKRTIGDA